MTRRVLIIVENLPVPFDRRVWQEASTLRDAGYSVSIICPATKDYPKRRETIDGIEVYRHPLPHEADGAVGYALEYGSALFWELYLATKIAFSRGFDVIHACNPPDLIFMVAAFFKPFGKKFVFDHHDINPELYEAKFGRRDFFYRLMLWAERLTFRLADMSIATNHSYRKIAIERGGMDPDKVFVVRSGPKLDRLKLVPPKAYLKQGRKYLVGYVGVMGKQEGIDLLLETVRVLVHEKGRQDIHFGLVGGGTSLDEMKELAGKLGVDNYVTFTGRVSDADLLDMLNTADVCVNPDVANAMNDASTMNKIMEYMALAKPIVQFDLTEGRYSAQDASLYAQHNDPHDMADKIIALLDDPERRKKMGEFGRNRVINELEWKYEAPKLLAAYDSLWKTAD
ncbi:glycosyltransferase family 4 protein [Qipengyuania gaetbuli]|uniref:glycosyltransferase family 4 protein n=1 Tax=Qipengyuania gaetbuli TaxID=266952 RepID=UPI001CD2DA2D|nr:glycosyltransferase family 4 protein [Qipengyuania gaetbuli]MCA0908936.1 glycosyltransferase family 4 protein [Qipengyuania gaetbuli]